MKEKELMKADITLLILLRIFKTIWMGSHGVPEYGVGAVNFPDFIELQAATSSDDVPRKACLERQVGSHYFVTASNAGKILALAYFQICAYTAKIFC